MSNIAQPSNSIKDYYIRLERMHKNVQNMLSALNQSLISNTAEVTVTVADSDDALTTLKIPSFLYLENKLEELDNNFGNIFNLPESGDAFITNSSSNSDIYKVELIRSNIAPSKPELSKPENESVRLTVNNILKDMVSPKTFIRYNISNLSDITEGVIMKKYIFYNESLFDSIYNDTNSGNTTIHSFSDFNDKLYGYKLGADYDTYESKLELPVKNDILNSEFDILKIYTDNDADKIHVTVNTVQYFDSENSSNVYYLSVGNKLVYHSPDDKTHNYAEFIIEEINPIDNSTNKELILKETKGHINFNTSTNSTIDETDTNSDKIPYQNLGYFSIVNSDWSKFKYVDIPLEENDHIAFSIGVIYNGIRSVWSTPIVVDLNNIYVTDNNGNKIKDDDGNELNYIEYYNKYCSNIGDLIQGITDAAYPQISNYTSQILYNLQNGDIISECVNNSISSNNIKVVPINKHLTDDTTNEEILSLHSQKNEIYAQIQTVQSNIDSISSQLLNSDFSTDTSSKQQTLQSQLTQYYSQKTLLTKQFNSLVSTLSSKISQLNTVTSNIKYRLRGITDINDLTDSIYSVSDSQKTELIGMEVYYKYKSVNKDTTSVTVINSDTFSEWNIQRPVQRDRYMSFNTDMTDFVVKYLDYNNTSNLPQWNQIDIPIKAGEDLIVKVRYIYNIGYPFITLYTPWSNEQTFVFPEEYKEDTQVSTIVDQNNDDTIQASFSQKLINDGYTDHINDKIINNTGDFFHTADHIYSGFNTTENNLLSLKEKLQLMVNDINNYKELLDDKTKATYKVSISIGNNEETVIKPNIKNKINVYNTNNTNNRFIKQTINITIKNTSENNLRLYSLFPGNVSTPLLYSDINPEYNKSIIHYERVPIIANNKIEPQRLGQWIYFRQSDPYTNTDIYLNDDEQNKQDMLCVDSTTKQIKEPIFIKSAKDYMNVNNKQVLLPYRFRLSNTINEQDTMLLLCSTMSKVKAFFDSYGEKIIKL